MQRNRSRSFIVGNPRRSRMEGTRKPELREDHRRWVARGSEPGVASGATVAIRRRYAASSSGRVFGVAVCGRFGLRIVGHRGWGARDVRRIVSRRV